MDEDVNWDEGKHFLVRLVLSHPTMHPDVITTNLLLEPEIAWPVGEPRFIPPGRRLPGVHRETRWQVCREIVDTRSFFKACVEILAEVIEPRAEFMREFIGTGGMACLNVDLQGSMNVGDLLSVSDMRRFIAVGVDVGLEVFP